MECPQCGKRALSVATRCPHCGFSFPSRPLHRPVEGPSLGWSVPRLAAAALVAAIVLAMVYLRGAPPTGEDGRAAAPAGDSVAATGPAPAASAPAGDSVVSAPVPAASGPSGNPTARRYARTWANVRGGRGRSAPAVATLNPGELVMVDSLIRGWYRVVVEGRAVGYVHRSTLAAAPPE
jgi:hypothetical protein